MLLSLLIALNPVRMTNPWCCTNCLGENLSLDRCQFCGAASPDAAHRYARNLGASTGVARPVRLHLPARVATQCWLALRHLTRGWLDQVVRRR
jgi:hypothetical protein